MYKISYYLISVGGKAIDKVATVWDDLSFICNNHGASLHSDDCQCTKVWSVSDMNGKIGSTVAEESFHALMILSKHGISNSLPQNNDLIWPDGVIERNDGTICKQGAIDRLKNFCLVIRRIMLKGLAFPNSSFTVSVEDVSK